MRVLAAVDGSTGSLAAARYGAVLSGASGGDLVLLHVVEGTPASHGPSVPTGGWEGARVHAASVMTTARNAIGSLTTRVAERVLAGDPADAICAEARGGGYSLVTMGSRGVGRTGLARLLVGSVALGVLSDAPPPVLLVPDQIADLSRTPEVRSLLVPTDGSRASLASAEFAAEVAVVFAAKVLLLHCEERLLPGGFAALALTDEDRRRIEANQERVGRVILRVTQEPFLLRGHPVDVVEARGSPIETILQVARETAVSLIVMGSYGIGESWLKRQRLGSTTEGVLSDAPCPVIVCKQPLA